MIHNSVKPDQIGLKPHHCQLIENALMRSSAIESAWLFGSRVMGTFKDSSDIDIALKGKYLTLDDIVQLQDIFEQSSLPFKVDIVVIERISNDVLLAHIQCYGLQIK